MRGDLSYPFVYSLEDGRQLKLGAGKTFICIVPSNLDTTFD